MAKLGEVCTIVSGSTPKTSVTSYWDGNIKWITPAELNEDTFYIMDSVRHITEEGKEKTGLSYLPAGTVILSSRAPIGKTAIAGCEMCCNQGFKNLICSDAIYNEYLYFFLKSKTDYLNSLGRGATFKEISKSIVENIEIPLPEVNQQKEIAEKFKKLEQLISLRKQQLAKLDELVKARFVEMFGDLASPACPWKKEKIVNICADQDDIKCGPFGTQLSKDEYQSTGVAVWEIPQINSNFLLKPTHFITAEKALQLESYSIIPGDIAMSRKGNVGRCAVFPENLKNGIIHSDVLRIRIDKKRAVPTFMMHQLHNSNFIKHQIELVSSGAIMAGINVTKLKEIEVHLPPLTLQNEFAAFVERVDQQKQTVQQSLEKLELMRKALMQEYFG
ncbi:MAG: restriction endonuclease subunit S [Faecalibacterium sp.]